MSTCCRVFLVDRGDRIYRFGLERFAEVLQHPARERFPLFAGKRIRMVNAFVEVIDRRPLRVRWMTYHVLPFDRVGYLEAEVFRRQEASRYEVWMQSKIFPLAREAGDGHGVVDAGARFAARGGLWVPSKSLEGIDISIRKTDSESALAARGKESSELDKAHSLSRFITDLSK